MRASMQGRSDHDQLDQVGLYDIPLDSILETATQSGTHATQVTNFIRNLIQIEPAKSEEILSHLKTVLRRNRSDPMLKMAWLFIKECVKQGLISSCVVELSNDLNEFQAHPKFADLQIKLMYYLQSATNLDFSSLEHIISQILEIKRVVATSKVSECKRKVQMDHIRRIQEEFEQKMIELL